MYLTLPLSEWEKSLLADGYLCTGKYMLLCSRARIESTSALGLLEDLSLVYLMMRREIQEYSPEQMFLSRGVLGVNLANPEDSKSLLINELSMTHPLMIMESLAVSDHQDKEKANLLFSLYLCALLIAALNNTRRGNLSPH